MIPAWCVCVLSSCDQLQSCPWKKAGEGCFFFQPPLSSRLFWDLLHADLGDFERKNVQSLISCTAVLHDPDAKFIILGSLYKKNGICT